MLNRARSLAASYGERFKTHLSDLFTTNWLPTEIGPFDAAVSSICLHNLRDFDRISEIYREIRAHLKSNGIFLNEDLINAPTAELKQRYDTVSPDDASEQEPQLKIFRQWSDTAAAWPPTMRQRVLFPRPWTNILRR